MNDRTFGETKNCAGCRFWSEMIAMSEGGGPVKSMCVAKSAPDAPQSGKYTVADQTCPAWRSGHHGAVDEPGEEGDETFRLYDAEESPEANTKYPTCEAVGECPMPTADAAPFHHFYWDSDRDTRRMNEIHNEGRGHDDPASDYGAVVCKTCNRCALVLSEADDFPSI